MRRNIAGTLATGALIAALSISGCAPADPLTPRAEPVAGSAEELARSLNEVGFALFKAADAEGNLALSPASIGIAFGVLRQGSSGGVSDALDQLFDYPASGQELGQAFNTLDLELASEAGDGAQDAKGKTVDLPIVRIANRVFVDNEFQPEQTYLDEVARHFGAAAQKAPLATDAEQSRKIIDGWVDEQTQGLIPKVMPETMPTPDTRLIIANTVYLKAQWLHPFDSNLTHPREFTTSTGKVIEADAMSQDFSTRYVTGDGFDAAVIPYVGDLEMLLIVPHAGEFQSVSGKLSQDFLDALDGSWQSGLVGVQLPTFESSSRADLKELIADRLGVNSLFDAPGLDGIGPDLEVSAAVHATKVIVDEKGTEAAAATIIEVGVTSMPPPPAASVIADKPFLYLVRDVPTGAVLFVGRIVDPTAG